jgi:hypothetical protein
VHITPSALLWTAIGPISVLRVLYWSPVDMRPPNLTFRRPFRSVIAYIGDLGCYHKIGIVTSKVHPLHNLRHHTYT